MLLKCFSQKCACGKFNENCIKNLNNPECIKDTFWELENSLFICSENLIVPWIWKSLTDKFLTRFKFFIEIFIFTRKSLSPFLDNHPGMPWQLRKQANIFYWVLIRILLRWFAEFYFIDNINFKSKIMYNNRISCKVNLVY